MSSSPVIAVVGPTAIGKTALSIELAHRFNCEIVSVDSMQVYKYMDIGTAKIGREEMDGIPHHLIDIVTPDVEYDAARFVEDATQSINEIRGRGRVPLLTGGTGLYLKALCQGLAPALPHDKKIRDSLYRQSLAHGIEKLHEQLRLHDPISASRIHPNDAVRIVRGLEIFLTTGIPWSTHIRTHQSLTLRPQFPILQLALTCDRDLLYKRINLRTIQMLESGLEGEVTRLLAMGYGRDLKSMNSIGYRHMLNYLDHTWSFGQMTELLQRDTRRYAKRQYTWFRGIDDIEWFAVDDRAGISTRISQWLDQQLHDAGK